MAKKRILVTGGAGFIGSNFVKTIACASDVFSNYSFYIIDALTYAGKKENIQPELAAFEIPFSSIDIRDRAAVDRIFEKEQFDGVIHFAAETHVDRSIENPNIFLETNVIGTLNLLNAARKIFEAKAWFRFLQVSTDEVYGSLHEHESAFIEELPLKPNSPYSASKASADLLALSYFKTYKLPVIITRCSNNYGPYQYAEKLIPLMIIKALNNEPLPVYGDGQNIRDWIYVDDHNEGVWGAFGRGRPGEIYNFGGNSEIKNIDLVKMILKELGRCESLIKFVSDRPGHDWRYAMNYNKAKKELKWKPKIKFVDGLKKTISWYKEAWMEL